MYLSADKINNLRNLYLSSCLIFDKDRLSLIAYETCECIHFSGRRVSMRVKAFFVLCSWLHF